MEAVVLLPDWQAGWLVGWLAGSSVRSLAHWSSFCSSSLWWWCVDAAAAATAFMRRSYL